MLYKVCVCETYFGRCQKHEMSEQWGKKWHWRSSANRLWLDILYWHLLVHKTLRLPPPDPPLSAQWSEHCDSVGSTFETTRRAILFYCRLMSGTIFPFAFLPSAHASLSVAVRRSLSTKLCDSRDGNRRWFLNHNTTVTGVSVLWVTPIPRHPTLQRSSKRKIKAFGLFAYHLHTNPNWLFLDARRLGSLFITCDSNLFLLFVEFASDYYVPQFRPGNKRPDDLNCFGSTQECECSRKPN